MSDLAEAVSRFERAKEEYAAAADALRAITARELAVSRKVDGWHVTPDLRDKIDRIVSIVAEESGVSVQEIFSRERTVGIARARLLSMVYVRRLLNLRLTHTAVVFRRDHGTIVHAERSIDAERDTDKKFAALYESLIGKCRAAVGAP